MKTASSVGLTQHDDISLLMIGGQHYDYQQWQRLIM